MMETKTPEREKLYLDGVGFGWKRVAIDRPTILKAVINGELPVYLHVDNSDHVLLCKTRELNNNGQIISAESWGDECEYGIPEWDSVELLLSPSDVKEIAVRPFVQTPYLGGTIQKTSDSHSDLRLDIIKTPNNFEFNVKPPADTENTFDEGTRTVFTLFGGERLEPDKEFTLTLGDLYSRVDEVETVFPNAAKQYLEDFVYTSRNEIIEAFKKYGRPVKWTQIRSFRDEQGLGIKKEGGQPTLWLSELFRFLNS